MEEIKRDKALEEAALDDKALEKASGGLVYPEYLRQWFPKPEPPKETGKDSWA